VNLFGESMASMWQDAVEAAGNYGTMYEANMESAYPRSGYNLLNNGSGPQVYAIPGTFNSE
jgi:hypothetical protein